MHSESDPLPMSDPQFALHTLMWHRAPLAEVLGHAVELGLSALDLGALPGCGHADPGAGDPDAEAARVAGMLPSGLRVVAVTADHAGLSSLDGEEREAGVRYTIGALGLAEALGAGVVGTSLGSVPKGVANEQCLCRAAEAINACFGQYAGPVRLAVELHVNDVVNDLAKAERLLELAGQPGLGVAFDTSLLYHNRIHHADAFQRLGDRLLHVHLRGATPETYFAVPGRDEVDFAGFFSLLTGTGYGGAMSLELYEVPERYGLSTLEAARESLRYLRSLWPPGNGGPPSSWRRPP